MLMSLLHQWLLNEVGKKGEAGNTHIGRTFDFCDACLTPVQTFSGSSVVQE